MILFCPNYIPNKSKRQDFNEIVVIILNCYNIDDKHETIAILIQLALSVMTVPDVLASMDIYMNISTKK